MAIELTNISPAASSVDCPRSWSLTVDVTDATNGVDSGVELRIDGVLVTASETTITDGIRLEYTPGSASSYGARITAQITATPTGQSAESVEWRWTITTGTSAEATATSVPYVAVVQDVGLSAAEADETTGGVNVVWLDDITHPLIVTEDQAETVGDIALEDENYHQHQRTLKVLRTDANGDFVASLQEGDAISFTASALGETAQSAEVLAIQQAIDQQDDVVYTLLVGYYEQAWA